MGFFSGLVGAIGGFLGGVAGAIGGALGAAATFLGGLVASPVFLAVIGLVSTISTFLGLTKEKEKPEELGAKIALSDKKPQDFTSYQAYIEHLSNNVELTDEMKDRLKDEKFKRECMCLGAAAQWQGINEKLGMNMDISSAENLARAGVNTAEQFKIIADTFKEKEVEPKIGEAIDKKTTIKEKVEVIGTLKEGVLKIENSKEIWDKLDNMLEGM